ARAPGLAQPYWQLSQLRKATPEANLVDVLRTQLATPGDDPERTPLLAYALPKERDEMGEYEGAAEALELACRSKRARIRYERADAARLFDALAALEGGAAIGSAEAAGARTPVFIVGMHRSGTTLLEQLLDGHREIRGVGELYDFTSQMRYATDHHCRGVLDSTIVARAGSGEVDWKAVGEGYLSKM